jgi:hypothetical protein
VRALLAILLLQGEPYEIKTPEKWGKERIPFPLGFAKDIDYKGFEELRFAPGMFKPEADDYFSYAFLFWLEGTVAVDAKTLEADLLKYYKGLCTAVAKSRKLELDFSKIAVKATKQEGKPKLAGEESDFYHARIDWFDPFTTGKPLTLHLELWSRPADAGKSTCLFALASPKEKSAPVWEVLRKIQADFSCPK